MEIKKQQKRKELQLEFENEILNYKVENKSLYKNTIVVKNTKTLCQIIYTTLEKTVPNNNELTIDMFSEIYNICHNNDEKELNLKTISCILNKLNRTDCEKLGVTLAYYIDIMKDIQTVINNYNIIISPIINKYKELESKIEDEAE